MAPTVDKRATGDGAPTDGAPRDEAPVASPVEAPVAPPVEPTVEAVARVLRDTWRARGCVDLPPCALEVPLPILHPQIVFRLLGDARWRSVCLQSVTRANDARGGRHPVRTARHLEVHVAMRDARAREARGWLLTSLEPLGIDASRHELTLVSRRRRVETLDAEGVGWALRVDGLEVGHATLWRRFAGRPTEASPDRSMLEISCIVERLALIVAGVDDVFSLRWSEARRSEAAVRSTSYASLRRRAEEEAARYADEVTSAEWLRGLVDGFEDEARRCLDAGLLRPAYEQAVQALVPLDLLARRGEQEPLERRRRLEALRQIVVAVADAVRELTAGELTADRSPSPGDATDDA